MKKAAWILGTLSLILAVSNFFLWNQLRRQQADAGIAAKRPEALPACGRLELQPSPGTSCGVGSTSGLEPATKLPPEADPELYGRVHRDPRFQAAMVDYQRIDLRQQYAAFLSKLRLSAEKENQLMMILAQQRVRGAQGIPNEYTREEWQRRNDEELLAVLSQSQVDDFRHYRETAGIREQVQSLRDELMATREPLRDDQVESLVDALHPEEVQFAEEVRAFNEDLDRSADELPDSERKAEDYFADREKAATERKLTAAGAILSREQLKALERRLEAQRAMGKQGSRLRHLQFELAKSISQSGGDEAPTN